MLTSLAAMSEAAFCVNRGDHQNAFGHLVILLRDVPDQDDNAYAVLFGKEDTKMANSDEEAEGMDDRNKTRDLLTTSLQSIRMVCLPLPHPAIGGMCNGPL